MVTDLRFPPTSTRLLQPACVPALAETAPPRCDQVGFQGLCQIDTESLYVLSHHDPVPQQHGVTTSSRLSLNVSVFRSSRSLPSALFHVPSGRSNALGNPGGGRGRQLHILLPRVGDGLTLVAAGRVARWFNHDASACTRRARLRCRACSSQPVLAWLRALFICALKGPHPQC